MTTKKVDLYKYFNLQRSGDEKGYLTIYLHEKMQEKPNRLRPAMLIIAGGAYQFVSDREGECVALTYLANGYNTFVLDYSIAPIKYPVQLNEGLMAMAYIRENANKLGVDKEHIGAIGFSAGGHLCGMLANLFDSDDALKLLGEKTKLSRPDAVILSYPVITSGVKTHGGSFVNLCGDNKGLKAKLSLEKNVKQNSSPAFIWATVNDDTVPSENSILYATACKKQGVPFELHLFENGQHGLSLANEEVYAINKPVQEWVALSLTWLKNRGFVIKDSD